MITFETRAVLADAYPRRRARFAQTRTHTVVLVDGDERRVLCRQRVRLENLADPLATDAGADPTCPRCLATLIRMRTDASAVAQLCRQLGLGDHV